MAAPLTESSSLEDVAVGIVGHLVTSLVSYVLKLLLSDVGAKKPLAGCLQVQVKMGREIEKMAQLSL